MRWSLINVQYSSIFCYSIFLFSSTVLAYTGIENDWCLKQGKSGGSYKIDVCSPVFIRCEYDGKTTFDQCSHGNVFDGQICINPPPECRSTATVSPYNQPLYGASQTFAPVYPPPQNHQYGSRNLDSEHENDACVGQPDGGEVDLGPCSQWYGLCQYGRMKSMQCPVRHVFDRSSKQCLLATMVRDCNQSPASAYNQGSETRPPVDPAFCRGKPDGNYANGNCEKTYVYCKDGHALIGQCSKARFVFNPATRQCEHTSTVSTCVSTDSSYGHQNGENRPQSNAYNQYQPDRSTDQYPQGYQPTPRPPQYPSVNNRYENGQCPRNEVYKECGSACEPTCHEPRPSCNQRCVAGCHCQSGYVRSSYDGDCVPTTACSSTYNTGRIVEAEPWDYTVNSGCGSPNEIFLECASCQPTCSSPTPTCDRSRCNPGCGCRDGYVRSSDGRCVLRNFCNFYTHHHPRPSSGIVASSEKVSSEEKCQHPNEHFDKCQAWCQPTCTDPNMNCQSRRRCVPGCVCLDGYLRNHVGVCVKANHCNDVPQSSEKKNSSEECSSHDSIGCKSSPKSEESSREKRYKNFCKDKKDGVYKLASCSSQYIYCKFKVAHVLECGKCEIFNGDRCVPCRKARRCKNQCWKKQQCRVDRWDDGSHSHGIDYQYGHHVEDSYERPITYPAPEPYYQRPFEYSVPEPYYQRPVHYPIPRYHSNSDEYSHEINYGVQRPIMQPATYDRSRYEYHQSNQIDYNVQRPISPPATYDQSHYGTYSNQIDYHVPQPTTGPAPDYQSNYFNYSQISGYFPRPTFVPVYEHRPQYGSHSQNGSYQVEGYQVPYGQRPTQPPYYNPYGQLPVQPPRPNPYGQRPILVPMPYGRRPQYPTRYNPYGQRPQQPPRPNPYVQQPIQPPRPNPYEQQPVLPVQYGQQPILPMPYGQQPPRPNPYVHQPIQPPRFNPYEQQPVLPVQYVQQPIAPVEYGQRPVQQPRYNTYLQRPILLPTYGQHVQQPIQPPRPNPYEQQAVLPVQYVQQPIVPIQYGQRPIQPQRYNPYRHRPIPLPTYGQRPVYPVGRPYVEQPIQQYQYQHQPYARQPIPQPYAQYRPHPIPQPTLGPYVPRPLPQQPHLPHTYGQNVPYGNGPSAPVPYNRLVVDTDGICRGLVDRSLVALGKCKREYAECINGLAVPKICDDRNQVYDHVTRRCINREDEPFCRTMPPIPYPTRPTGELANHCTNMQDGYYRHPSNCTMFIQCHQTYAYIFKCSPGLVFNIEATACDYPRNVKDCTDPDLGTGIDQECEGVDDGQFLKHPADCKKYRRCVHGRVVEQECPDQLVFNTNLNVCDHAHNVPHCKTYR